VWQASRRIATAGPQPIRIRSRFWDHCLFRCANGKGTRPGAPERRRVGSWRAWWRARSAPKPPGWGVKLRLVAGATMLTPPVQKYPLFGRPRGRNAPSWAPSGAEMPLVWGAWGRLCGTFLPFGEVYAACAKVANRRNP